ncbi:SNF1-related protein kinase regulatory subunit gamma-1-like isoform X2 [Silene latifolia]|uniref:SNF1-related protein kinase regulatory subunit gamma-1-like isoform X2 n=1 Tax=Silene latifolia TaxID=37657 RepID=UPI003D781680
MEAILEEIPKQGTETVKNGTVDSASALQAYLNSIPISAFPNIRNTPVLEVQAVDLLRDAMLKLYQKNVSVALIRDPSAVNSDTSVTATAKFSDRYIGVISFTSMVLWCIQHLQTNNSGYNKTDVKKQSFDGFFSRLDQDPQVKQTKVAELAKLFLWDSFFPVHLENDTLFHVLLLLSKHRLKVVPVIERFNSRVISFITQNDIIKLLLKSQGLQWFDDIANSRLSEFHFEREDAAYQVYEDQTVSEALSVLSEKRVVAVAVVRRNNKELVGSVRDTDISLLLDNDDLLTATKKITLEEFIKMNNENDDNSTDSETDKPLRINISSIPRMDSPIVHRETDILQNVMTKMAETNTESSFLVDGSCRVVGMITLRDIIVEFAPPCVDSRIDGGGFFESALQQTGCHVNNGTIVCDH